LTRGVLAKRQSLLLNQQADHESFSSLGPFQGKEEEEEEEDGKKYEHSVSVSVFFFAVSTKTRSKAQGTEIGASSLRRIRPFY